MCCLAEAKESPSPAQSGADGCSVDADTVLALPCRGQAQAVGSREQLFCSSFQFSALFHRHDLIVSCFQGTGKVSHGSAVDLPT